MKRKLYKPLIGLVALLPFAACSHDEETATRQVPDGMVQVEFQLPGSYAGSVSGFEGKAVRAAGAPWHDEQTLDGKPTDMLPDGTTLWIIFQKEGDTAPQKPKSYIVQSTGGGGSSLYPCEVDEEGNATSVGSAPLLLEEGAKYTFAAVSPARQFVDETKMSLLIDNGEYLISNDERYTQTQRTKVEIKKSQEGDDVKIQVVELPALINQTAQLKFTLEPDDDGSVHDLEILPGGMEVSGLQKPMLYPTEGATGWNWSLMGEGDTPMDTLRTSVTNKTEKVVQHDYTKEGKQFVFETAILPTDATSTPLIVLFNLRVNGNPTQYEMMLNEKVFRAARSYHYKGTVKITDNVVAIVWQTVQWSTEVEFN